MALSLLIGRFGHDKEKRWRTKKGMFKKTPIETKFRAPDENENNAEKEDIYTYNSMLKGW